MIGGPLVTLFNGWASGRELLSYPLDPTRLPIYCAVVPGARYIVD